MSDRPKHDATALRKRAEAVRRSGPEEWLKEGLHIEVTGTLEAFSEYVAAAEARIAELEAALRDARTELAERDAPIDPTPEHWRYHK